MIPQEGKINEMYRFSEKKITIIITTNFADIPCRLQIKTKHFIYQNK